MRAQSCGVTRNISQLTYLFSYQDKLMDQGQSEIIELRIALPKWSRAHFLTLYKFLHLLLVIKQAFSGIEFQKRRMANVAFTIIFKKFVETRTIFSIVTNRKVQDFLGAELRLVE